MTTDLTLVRAFADAHPGDAARVLEQIPVTDAAPLLDALPPQTLARVFDQMTPAPASAALVHMRADVAAALLTELPTNVAAALLRQADDPARQRILDALAPGEAAAVRRHLDYPVGSAGALMDPRVMAVADDVTAGEALTRIRRAPGNLLYYVYVVDRTRRLVGAADLREVMLARPADPMSAVMRTPVVSVSAHASRPTVLAHPAWKRLHALPVVDEESGLVGAIRYQTFRRLEDELRNRPPDAGGTATVFALGELYWLSLSGLFEGVATVAKSSPSHPSTLPEVGHERS